MREDHEVVKSGAKEAKNEIVSIKAGVEQIVVSWCLNSFLNLYKLCEAESLFLVYILSWGIPFLNIIASMLVSFGSHALRIMKFVNVYVTI